MLSYSCVPGSVLGCCTVLQFSDAPPGTRLYAAYSAKCTTVNVFVPARLKLPSTSLRVESPEDVDEISHCALRVVVTNNAC